MDDIKHEVKKLHIGRKIRDLRKKAGLILQDLSDRTGLSKPLLSQIEKEVVDSRYFGREESGYYYEALAYKKSKKYMEPFLVEFKKKKAEKLSYFSHEGEEFIYLLEGTLEFRTEDQQYVLYPGDSLYFESSIPHAYRALERKNAKALTVVYPER